VCQNSPLSAIDDISVNIEVIINRYINNPITKSIVCGGLEPFDSFNDLLQLISHLRVYTNDDIVIYTGYNKEEIIDKIEKIIVYKNIIIKYGRFIPDQEKHFDEILGAWCEEKDIAYTRYSDDMTFSGNFNPTEMIVKVRKMLYKLGLKLNNDKVHVVNKSSSQNVTGIVVNKKAQVCSKYRKDIRQEIYYIRKYGLISHLEHYKYKQDSKVYLNSLYGRILYVLQINNNDLEFRKYKQYIENLRGAI